MKNEQRAGEHQLNVDKDPTYDYFDGKNAPAERNAADEYYYRGQWWLVDMGVKGFQPRLVYRRKKQPAQVVDEIDQLRARLRVTQLWLIKSSGHNGDCKKYTNRICLICPVINKNRELLNASPS